MNQEPIMLSVDEDFVKAAYDAACHDWKRKIEEKFPHLMFAEFDKRDIYGFASKSGNLYKLHRVSEDRGLYAWIDVSTSDCYANGVGTAIDQLRYAKRQGTVKVLHTVQQFAEWITTNQKQ
jgi:hypothetical protein